MDNQLTRAALIVRELQEWLDRLTADWGDDQLLDAGYAGSADQLVVAIGGIALWDSDHHDLDDLATDFCKQQFREYAKSLQVFALDADSE